MLPIDPSHFVALSFLILVGVLIWKRFFNLSAVLDEEINTIKEIIHDAEQNREMAYNHLKKIGSELEGVEAKIVDIIEKGHSACDTLILSIREEISAQIAQKQTLHALQAKHLEERFRKIYQEQLIAHILKKLTIHLKTHVNDSFYEEQLEQSLELLSSMKIAA